MAQLLGASSKPKDRRFDSWSGHMPGLWVHSLVGVHARGNVSLSHQRFSPSLSPRFPLLLKSIKKKKLNMEFSTLALQNHPRLILKIKNVWSYKYLTHYVWGGNFPFLPSCVSDLAAQPDLRHCYILIMLCQFVTHLGIRFKVMREGVGSKWNNSHVLVIAGTG